MNNAWHDRTGIQQQVMQRLRRRRGASMSLRMAPMIDVIFLLLTFFVLTIRFRTPEQFLPISLPAAARIRTIGVVEPLVMEIAADDGRCTIKFARSAGARESVIRADNIDGDLAAFVGDFVGILESQNRHVGDPIEIVCSDEVKWDYLVKVYNVLYAMGINDITFAMTE